jgi:serine phosphatase RsbU (regulator of sigma subunit)/PAS domain-containing protein
MLATLLGGLGPALLAGLIAAALTALTIVDDFGASLADWGHSDSIRWLVFLMACLPVIALGLACRSALTREAGARRALEEAGTRLSLALEAGRMGTWTADGEGRTLTCSPEAREVLRVPAGERLGSFDDLLSRLHPDHRDAVRTTLSHSFDWAAGQDIQARLVDDGPEAHWVLFRGRVLTPLPGRPKSMVGVVVDISRHKRTEVREAFLARLSSEIAVPAGSDDRMRVLAAALSSGVGDACLVRVAAPGEPEAVVAAVDGRECAPPTDDVADTAWLAGVLAATSGRDVFSSGAVPLVIGGGATGIILVGRRSGHFDFSADDHDLLHEASARAGVAIENGRLFERQRAIAETLQRNLLPPELPAIADIDIAAAYTAAGEGIDVGGDFYDAFETAKGCWVVAIGDVCGKGTAAASLTALARHSMRVAALADPHPGRILEALNLTLRRHMANESPLMTAACVLIDRRPGHMEVTLARAGHPPPLLVKAGGGVTALEPQGPLLGVFDSISVQAIDVVLDDDDALVFYTDGVTETRGQDGFFGPERLEKTAGEGAGRPASHVVQRIVSAIGAYRAGPSVDDVAVLVLRRVPLAPPASAQPEEEDRQDEQVTAH